MQSVFYINHSLVDAVTISQSYTPVICHVNVPSVAGVTTAAAQLSVSLPAKQWQVSTEASPRYQFTRK